VVRGTADTNRGILLDTRELHRTGQGELSGDRQGDTRYDRRNTSYNRDCAACGVLLREGAPTRDLRCVVRHCNGQCGRRGGERPLGAKALAKNDRIKFAYLFGSYAENNTTSLSDVDVAVYTDKVLHVSEKLQLIHELGKKSGVENLDIVFLNDRRNLLLMDEIIRNGLVLVDKDSDVRDEFELTIMHRAVDFKFQRKLFMDV